MAIMGPTQIVVTCLLHELACSGRLAWNWRKPMGARRNDPAIKAKAVRAKADRVAKANRGSSRRKSVRQKRDL